MSTYKDFLLHRVFIHYHAQVLTGSMCVYTSYIVPRVAPFTVGTRLFRAITGPLGVQGGEWEHHPDLNHLHAVNPAAVMKLT